MISINEFLVKGKIEKQEEFVKITSNELNKLLENNEYILFVEEYTATVPTQFSNGGWKSKGYYILAVGNDEIAAKYGQKIYDSDSLSGQQIDGGPTDHGKSLADNVLKEFEKISGKPASDKHRNPYKEECYYVRYEETSWASIKYTKQPIYILK